MSDVAGVGSDLLAMEQVVLALTAQIGGKIKSFCLEEKLGVMSFTLVAPSPAKQRSYVFPVFTQEFESIRVDRGCFMIYSITGTTLDEWVKARKARETRRINEAKKRAEAEKVKKERERAEKARERAEKARERKKGLKIGVYDATGRK